MTLQWCVVSHASFTWTHSLGLVNVCVCERTLINSTGTCLGGKKLASSPPRTHLQDKSWDDSGDCEAKNEEGGHKVIVLVSLQMWQCSSYCVFSVYFQAVLTLFQDASLFLRSMIIQVRNYWFDWYLNAGQGSHHVSIWLNTLIFYYQICLHNLFHSQVWSDVSSLLLHGRLHQRLCLFWGRGSNPRKQDGMWGEVPL